MKLQCDLLLLICISKVSSKKDQSTNVPSSPTDPLTTSAATTSISVLMLTSKFPAHFFLLLALGEELVSRGHNVTMLGPTLEGYEHLPKDAEKKGIKFISACYEQRSSYDVTRHAGKHEGSSFASILYNITRQSNREDTHMYKMVSKLKGMNRHHFNYIIFDNFVIPVALYIINEWKTNKVMTHFAPIPRHPIGLTPWAFPTMFSPLTDNMSFMDRLLNTAVYSPLELVGMKILKSFLSNFNQDMTTDEPIDAFFGVKYPVLYNTIIGFDWPRTTLPLQHYIGPMLTSSPPPIDVPLSNWLEGRPARSVIYISMGTSVDVTPEIVSAVLSIASSGGNNRSIVWSTRNDLSDYIVDKGRVYLTPWVSQLAVLNHPTISLSIIHCGLNSLQESLYHGVPVICIPSAFDQFDVSLRLVSQGLGARIMPGSINERSLREAIADVSSSNVQDNVNKIRTIMRASGGVKRAADLVQLYAEVGHDHGIPSYAKYNWYWYEFYNLDVYAVIWVLVVMLVWMVRKVCGFMICFRCRDKKIKTD